MTVLQSPTTCKQLHKGGYCISSAAVVWVGNVNIFGHFMDKNQKLSANSGPGNLLLENSQPVLTGRGGGANRVAGLQLLQSLCQLHIYKGGYGTCSTVRSGQWEHIWSLSGQSVSTKLITSVFYLVLEQHVYIPIVTANYSRLTIHLPDLYVATVHKPVFVVRSLSLTTQLENRVQG